MKNLFKYLSIVLVSLLATNCSEYEAGSENSNPTLNYGFKATTAAFDVSNVDNTYKIVVFSTMTSNVDRTVEVVLNAAESTYDVADFTFSEMVVIPAGALSGEGDIVFDYDNLVAGQPGELVFDLVAPDDGTPNISANEITIAYEKVCLANSVVLDIVFDGYASETSWELFHDGNLIASASQGDYADGLTNFTQTFCLESGDYDFFIYDSFDDGLSYPTNGNFSMTLGSTVLGSGGGDFGSEASFSFTL